jgi:hypothetical protein
MLAIDLSVVHDPVIRVRQCPKPGVAEIRRYCKNSAALEFIPQADMPARGYGDLLAWLE